MLDIGQVQSDIQALNEGNEDQRRDALQSLRSHDRQAWANVPMAARKSLVAALQGQVSSGAGRQSAQKDIAAILANLGPLTRSALPPLLELLQAGVPDSVRGAAVTAVGDIGKDARPAIGRLVELLASSRPALAVQVIRALGNIGCADDEVRSVLVERWVSPPHGENAREHVAIALCKLHIHANNLLRTLTADLMGAQHASVRRAAAEALAWCGTEEIDVVPSLLKASLSDTNGEVRETAQAGLDRMGLSHEKAVEVCVRQLGMSAHAEGALKKCGALAVPALIGALASDELEIRLKAMRALEFLGELGVDAIPALTSALQDKDLNGRLAALKALWSVSKSADRVVPGFIKLLDPKTVAKFADSETRRQYLQTVMHAVGGIEPPAKAAVPALIILTKDDNRHVRESAARTMQKIAPAAAAKSASRG
jgi:HEAT repeat protein